MTELVLRESSLSSILGLISQPLYNKPLLVMHTEAEYDITHLSIIMQRPNLFAYKHDIKISHRRVQQTTILMMSIP